MVEQASCRAAAVIIIVGISGTSEVGVPTFGNDSVVSSAVRPGYLYGANDVIRPAGSARGY